LREQKGNIVSINASATSSLGHILISADTESPRLGMTICVESPSDDKALEPVSGGSVDWPLGCVWLHQGCYLCLIFIAVQAPFFKRSAILCTWLSSNLSSAFEGGNDGGNERAGRDDEK
jgi:hypothetical protein